jgi:hypothetical protein
MPALFSLFSLFSLFDSPSQIMKILKIIECWKVSWGNHEKIMKNNENNAKLKKMRIIDSENE